MGRTGELGRRGLGFIAVGGAAGALVRYLVAEAVPSTTFPWSTFLVNLAGCALLALALAPTRTKTNQRILGTGFCGGLTTFSTFSVEIASLAEDDQSVVAIAYLLASLAGGLAAYVAVRTFVTPGPPAPTSGGST